MAKLLYSAAVSLDGFIAGVNWDMSWLTEHTGDDNPMVDGLMHSVGAILAGGNTFRGDDPNRDTEAEGAFNGQWHGPQFVLTSRPPRTPVPGTTFVDDLGRAVTMAAQAAGDKYVNVLGAKLARSCLDAGLLDEVLMVVQPVLLGDGVRLFDCPGGTNVKLEPLSLTHTQSVANLWYRVA